MCGRYELNDLGKWEQVHPINPNQGYNFKKNYNVSPTQKMPVVVKDKEDFKLIEMKWGIERQIGPEIRKQIINTRANKALSPFWGKSVRNYRCLVPANGFYEWKQEDSNKTPYLIYSKKQKTFAFAGIYNPDQQTYSIMTTEPNKEMKTIHNRMPVILAPELENAWLSAVDDSELEQLLLPLEDGSLEMHKVSREVNSVKNNNPELLERF